MLIQRRTGRKKLGSEAINRKIVERPYQHRAIRNVARSFEQDGERKALLVMATGSGKTRTVIALVDLLMRAGWVKRVLFLADRVALVNQAAGAFKAHLPDAAPVNLVTERTSEGRVFLSTYPTMMNLIDGKQEGKAKFGPGHFDLIVIDEAHRSVYQRFRAIFEYFDFVPLVGLRHQHGACLNRRCDRPDMNGGWKVISSEGCSMLRHVNPTIPKVKDVPLASSSETTTGPGGSSLVIW